MKVPNSPSFVGEKILPCRPLDYIYDPLYTFSGPKDFHKAANEAYKTSSEFSIQPIFESMFSDMVRYPSATLVLRSSHHPKTFDTSYKGKVRATLMEKTEKPEVTGTDRYKYFKRPVTESQSGSPYTTRFPLLGGERVTNLGILAPPTTAEKLHSRSAKLSAAAQTRAVQTDYRESETQTWPWAPPVITRGETPEVLFLAQLSWGDGLPPGKHEVDVVERLRKKRAWEKQLPPPDSEANIKARYKLIGEMEKNDWEFREQELEALHEERMKRSEQILDQHVCLNRSKLNCRMEFLEHDINKRKEKKLAMFRHDKERALRKICLKNKVLKQRKMNIVDEHLHHTSELYGPMKRMGHSFRKRDLVLCEKSINIDKRDLHPEIFVESRTELAFERLAQPKKQRDLCVRETRWTLDNLVKLHRDLQDMRKKERKRQSSVGTFLTGAIELNPTLPEKDIQSVPITRESTEKLYQAATLIQRIIQGRAMQSLMHLGREHWRETIEEVNVAESMTEKEHETLLDQKNQVIHDSRLAKVVENTVGMNVGLTIGQTLELLAKELLRIKDEGAGHSQALQAECDRWRREGAESGRRQREARRREEHGLMFSRLMQVYQDSINEFMETLVIRARENEAKTQALEYAKEMARLAELEEAERLAEELKPVSGDLLFEFIAPEGLRALTRTCMLILRQKYLEARQCLCGAEPLRRPSVTKTETDSEHEPESRVSHTLEQKPVSEKGSYLTMKTYSYSDYSDETVKTSMKSEEFETLTSELVESEDSHYEVEALSSGTTKPESRCVTFGLTSSADSAALEKRLLAKVMRDMCYMAGALFRTAAKILNKALQLAGIPRASFEEALQRTMQVINEAREEVVRLILPQRREESTQDATILPSQLASKEILIEAARIVDDIMTKARERIRQKQQYCENSEAQSQTIKSDPLPQIKNIIDDIIKEAQRKVFQAVAEDFLYDLLSEAQEKVTYINKVSDYNFLLQS